MMKTTRTTLLAALVAVLLLFGGCSSDDPTDSSGPTSTASDSDGDDDDDGGGSGDVTVGRELYLASCQACHGPDAEGIDGLGKPLTPSDFVASSSSADLVAFVKVGRPTSDPANTTGIDMPPKGGNPALTDDEITDIVAYLESLN